MEAHCDGHINGIHFVTNQSEILPFQKIKFKSKPISNTFFSAAGVCSHSCHIFSLPIDLSSFMGIEWKINFIRFESVSVDERWAQTLLEVKDFNLNWIMWLTHNAIRHNNILMQTPNIIIVYIFVQNWEWNCLINLVVYLKIIFWSSINIKIKEFKWFLRLGCDGIFKYKKDLSERNNNTKKPSCLLYHLIEHHRWQNHVTRLQ